MGIAGMWMVYVVATVGGTVGAFLFPAQMTLLPSVLDKDDLPAIRACAFGIAVADGAAEVREAADLVTEAKGGHGAVREAVEHIIKAQGNWQAIVEHYGPSVH